MSITNKESIGSLTHLYTESQETLNQFSQSDPEQEPKASMQLDGKHSKSKFEKLEMVNETQSVNSKSMSDSKLSSSKSDASLDDQIKIQLKNIKLTTMNLRLSDRKKLKTDGNYDLHNFELEPNARQNNKHFTTLQGDNEPVNKVKALIEHISYNKVNRIETDQPLVDSPSFANYRNSKRISYRISNMSKADTRRTDFTQKARKEKEKNKKNRKKQESKMDIKERDIMIKFYLFILSNVLNILTVLLYIAQTYVTEGSKEEADLQIVEVCFSFYFILDYVLFLYYSSNRLSYVLNWDSLIDFITIFPSIITFFLLKYSSTDVSQSKSSLNLSFLRVFRIIRVVRALRILRIYKSLRALQRETSADTPIFKINPIKFQIFNLVFLLIVWLFICSGVVLGFQDSDDSGTSSFTGPKLGFFDAFYFMIVTSTTMGYGEIYPNTVFSRLFIVLAILFFLFMISYQVNKLLNLLDILGSGIDAYEESGHIIVIADKSIKLDIFLLEIRTKESVEDEDYKSKDVVIVSKDIENLPSYEYPFNKTYLKKLNQIDFEVLDQVNIINADAVFLFSIKDLDNCITKDKFSELTLLQIIQSKIDVDKIYIQTLFFDHNIDAHDSVKKGKSLPDFDGQAPASNVVKESSDMKGLYFKKMIPVMKIKNKILAKSLTIPGFAAFAQNLIMNNYKTPFSLSEYSVVMRNYFIGCESKLHIYPVPSSFIDRPFSHLVKSIYNRSIGEYFTMISSKEVKPILPIGVIYKVDTTYGQEKTSNSSFDEAEELCYLTLFPKGNLSEECKIVYIASDTVDFKSFLAKIEQSASKKLGIGEKTMEEIVSLNNEIDRLVKLESDKNLNSSSKKVQRRNSVKKLSSKTKPEKIVMPKEGKKGLSYDQMRTINIHKKQKISNMNTDQEFDGDLKKEEDEEELRFKEYKNDNTKSNLQLLKEADENYNNSELFNLMNDACINFFPQKIPISSDVKYFKNKILDLERDIKGRKFKGHILILGYQDNISNLLRLLFYSFPKRKVCIVTNRKNEEIIYKLLKQHKKLYYFKGDPINPFNLINAGVKSAFYTVFLCETIDSTSSEDINNILSFRTNDYFFNNNSIIEFWNSESIRHLGYIPVTDKNNIGDNEYLKPLFMNGKSIYLGHLDKLIASSFKNQDLVEAWLSLIDCGYEFLENRDYEEENLPIIVSIDLPKDYIGKEYLTLMKDLIDLEAIALGIYIQDPMIYTKLRDEGTLELDEQKNLMKIVPSHKKGLKRSKSIINEEFDPENHYKIIKENSYNDKAIMDFIDINNIPFPIFITNPNPGFILVEKSKIMVLFSKANKNISDPIKLTSVKEDKLQLLVNILHENKKRFNNYIDIIQKRFDESMDKTIKKLEKHLKQ